MNDGLDKVITPADENLRRFGRHITQLLQCPSNIGSINAANVVLCARGTGIPRERQSAAKPRRKRFPSLQGGPEQHFVKMACGNQQRCMRLAVCTHALRCHGQKGNDARSSPNQQGWSCVRLVKHKMTSNRSEDFNRFAVLGLVVKPGGYFAIVQTLNAKLIEPGTVRR